MDTNNYNLDNLVKLFKDKKGREVSENTIEVFKASLKRIEKVFDSKIEKLKYSFLYNPQIFLKLLENEDYSLNTIYASIASNVKLCGLLNCNQNILNKNLKILTDLKHKRDTYTLEQMKNLKEQNNWVEYKDIINKLDSVKEDFILNSSYEDYRNFLLLNLMIKELPVRLGNFSDMYLKQNININNINKLDKENYLIINKNSYIFVFNKYKTVKQYGTQIHIVEDILLDELLDIYFTKYYNKNNKYFLVDKNNNSLNSKQIGVILKSITNKLFNKNISVDLIRHIYITNFLNKNPSLKDKIKLANIMNHSLIQQEFYKKY